MLGMIATADRRCANAEAQLLLSRDGKVLVALEEENQRLKALVHRQNNFIQHMQDTVEANAKARAKAAEPTAEGQSPMRALSRLNE